MAHILIVEDEPTIGAALQMTFEMVGYSAEVAVNGQLALERLAKEPLPDLLIMDLYMPVMDGSATLKAMRQSDRLRNLPVILVTGAVRDALPPQEGAYQAMVDKPFRVQEVLSIVKRLLSAGES